MSASREKQNRQAAGDKSGPKTAKEAQQRRDEKRNNLLYGLIALVFVIVVVASVIWRSDFIPRMTNAATIDGQNYSAAEVGYYYQSAYRSFLNQNSYFLSYFGLDTSRPLKDQEISADTASMLGLEVPEAPEPAEGEEAEPVSTGITWRDYFMDQAMDNIAVIHSALKAAEAEGFQYPASVQAQYDDNMNALKSTAAASGLSVGQYLKSNYGAGMTENIYGKQLMDVLRYSAYADAYENSLTYSEDQLEETYNSDPNSYDHVSYESASLSGAAPSTTDDDGNTVEPTEEESAAALAAAQDTARKILDGYNNGGKLEDLAEEYDSTYNSNDNSSYSSGDVISEWLYDSARKAGDAAVLETSNIEYVVVFRERFRDENPTIDIRHILVPLGSGTLTEDDEGYDEEQAQLKADAHAKAEALLSQWQSGEATEASFADLAMQESADGSKYNGGLIDEVYEGQMVTEFNDWCFDASRKAGDTGVVDSQYGSHVMYFSGVNALNRWQTQAASLLRSKDYSKWEEDLIANVVTQRNESGLKFIG